MVMLVVMDIVYLL